jgi:hypothetical protein
MNGKFSLKTSLKRPLGWITLISASENKLVKMRNDLSWLSIRHYYSCFDNGAGRLGARRNHMDCSRT